MKPVRKVAVAGGGRFVKNEKYAWTTEGVTDGDDENREVQISEYCRTLTSYRNALTAALLADTVCRCF